MFHKITHRNGLACGGDFSSVAEANDRKGSHKSTQLSGAWLSNRTEMRSNGSFLGYTASNPSISMSEFDTCVTPSFSSGGWGV